LKNRNKQLCPACGLQYDKTMAHCKSEHHIYPKRYYAGYGPKVDICRSCHNLLERIINQKENKTILTKLEYENIYKDFILQQTTKRLAES